jgi:hypothetical protein
MVRQKLPALVWQEESRPPDHDGVNMPSAKQTSHMNHQNMQNQSTSGGHRFRPTADEEGNRSHHAGEPKRCWYAHCIKPEGSQRYYTIHAQCTAGGRDWGDLVGQVLCVTCYKQYGLRGTLERTQKNRATNTSSNLEAGVGGKRAGVAGSKRKRDREGEGSGESAEEQTTDAEDRQTGNDIWFM